MVSYWFFMTLFLKLLSNLDLSFAFKKFLISSHCSFVNNEELCFRFDSTHFINFSRREGGNEQIFGWWRGDSPTTLPVGKILERASLLLAFCHCWWYICNTKNKDSEKHKLYCGREMALQLMPGQFLDACWYILYIQECKVWEIGKYIIQIKIILVMPYLDLCIALLKIGCLFCINLLNFLSQLPLME